QASVALARRVLFDLSAQVRGRALAALKGRPAKQFVRVLVEGLQFPWPPVAEHAAAALVALELREAVPRLRAMLDAPEPVTPFVRKDGALMMRELVRVNPLRNCLLCHAPSYSADDVLRGRVPNPSEPLPPPSAYYGGSDGVFVRADITYLRQDF